MAPAGAPAGAPADAPAPQCPDDDAWAASLDKDAPRIVYSVLTGQRHHRTRVPAVQQTWARHISVRDALVFYSDRQEAAVPSVGLAPPANERIYSAGAWRNFPALAHLHDHRAEFGCFDWVFFCDDDTYVFPRALERVLSRHRASESKYLGVYHTARVDLEWKDPEAHVAYAHGGAVPLTKRGDIRSIALSVSVTCSAQCMVSVPPATSSKRECRSASASKAVPRVLAIQSSSRCMYAGVRSMPCSARTPMVAYSSYAGSSKSRLMMES